MRTSENCDAIYEVKKRPFLTISLFAHRSLCFPMAILKCNLKLCKTNSSLNWIGNIWSVLLAPFLVRVNFIVFSSHRPNFLDSNDCLLLFATFYVSLGAPEAGAEASRGWPQEKNYSSSLGSISSTRKTLFRKLRMMLSSLEENIVCGNLFVHDLNWNWLDLQTANVLE